MNCPYCQKKIFGWTGLQELTRFQSHLPKCKMNPRNLPLSDGHTTVITPAVHTMGDALNIRHESGQ